MPMRRATAPAKFRDFCKGECPIHLKGAPEVEHPKQRGGGVWGGAVPPPPENFCISYIKMVSSYVFPVIFIDTVLFKKGTITKRACVLTPWTPPASAPV